MSQENAPKPRRGVLLLNLGTPDSTSVRDVRRYLHQFLMDERVIDSPYWVRKFVVCCLILPRRPKESAHAYRKIWQDDGSPLLSNSRALQRMLQERIDMPVALGMRYGNPSTEAAIRSLLEKSDRTIDEILIIPLYPQFAMSSFETAVVEAQRVLAKLNYAGATTIFPAFYREERYIAALAENAREHLAEDYDHVLFSYHGLPERHIRKADPTATHCLQSENCCTTDSPAHPTCYRHQCLATTEALVRLAQIPEGKYSVSFQSRLGRDPWLKPYTDEEFVRLANAGVKNLLVICPAFVADCLETLEEILMRGRDTFLQAGGETLRMIPCLNDHPKWIGALKHWCETYESDGRSIKNGAGV